MPPRARNRGKRKLAHSTDTDLFEDIDKELDDFDRQQRLEQELSIIDEQHVEREKKLASQNTYAEDIILNAGIRRVETVSQHQIAKFRRNVINWKSVREGNVKDSCDSDSDSDSDEDTSDSSSDEDENHLSSARADLHLFSPPKIMESELESSSSFLERFDKNVDMTTAKKSNALGPLCSVDNMSNSPLEKWPGFPSPAETTPTHFLVSRISTGYSTEACSRDLEELDRRICESLVAKSPSGKVGVTELLDSVGKYLTSVCKMDPAALARSYKGSASLLRDSVINRPRVEGYMLPQVGTICLVLRHLAGGKFTDIIDEDQRVEWMLNVLFIVVRLCFGDCTLAGHTSSVSEQVGQVLQNLCQVKSLSTAVIGSTLEEALPTNRSRLRFLVFLEEALISGQLDGVSSSMHASICYNFLAKSLAISEFEFRAVAGLDFAQDLEHPFDSSPVDAAKLFENGTSMLEQILVDRKPDHQSLVMDVVPMVQLTVLNRVQLNDIAPTQIQHFQRILQQGLIKYRDYAAVNAAALRILDQLNAMNTQMTLFQQTEQTSSDNDSIDDDDEASGMDDYDF